MTNKIYLLLDEDEELPSDAYKKIVGVEVEKISEMETRRMEESFRKILSEIKINEKLEEIENSLEMKVEQVRDDIKFIEGKISSLENKIISNKEEFNEKLDEVSRSFDNLFNSFRVILDHLGEVVKSLNSFVIESSKSTKLIEEKNKEFKMLKSEIDEKLSSMYRFLENNEYSIKEIKKENERISDKISVIESELTGLRNSMDIIKNEIQSDVLKMLQPRI